VSEPLYGQAINAPSFRMVDIDGDTSDLSKISDTLVVMSFQRTYSLYSRLQIGVFRDWQAMISIPAQFWIISTESTPLVRLWRDSCGLAGDNFNYFGGEKSLSASLNHLPAMRICYNQKQYLKHEGYLSLIGMDSIWMTVDSMIHSTGGEAYRASSGAKASKCRIYPNPSTHYFRIDMPSGVSAQRLELYTMLGQKIREYPIVGNQQEFEWSDQDPSGLYLIRVVTADQSYSVSLIHFKEP